MRALCGLPSARQLASDSVARLFITAVKYGSKGCVSWLFWLPGLQQTNSAALEMLIQSTVLMGFCAMTADLLELPAAAQLSIDAMVRLLDSALTYYSMKSSGVDIL
jgi:hypothetical protein